MIALKTRGAVTEQSSDGSSSFLPCTSPKAHESVECGLRSSLQLTLVVQTAQRRCRWRPCSSVPYLLETGSIVEVRACEEPVLAERGKIDHVRTQRHANSSLATWPAEYTEWQVLDRKVTVRRNRDYGH